MSEPPRTPMSELRQVALVLALLAFSISLCVVVSVNFA